jgi:peptidoglycan/LPS O-acetylase OafA/YrhL
LTTPTALRIARYAEAVYGTIAFVLAFAIPLPPRGANVVLFAHWLGTALLAAAVCLRLGRPNRQTWYVAALLSGYILFNAIVAVARLVSPDEATLGAPAIQALVVGTIVLIAQVVVAYCLYQARELRTMAPAPRRR